MSTTQRLTKRAWVLAGALVTAFATTNARAACEMRLSDNPVDYGQLNRAELEASSVPNNDVLLGKRRLTLNVTCDAASPLALRFNASPAAQGEGFAFAGRGNLVVRVGDAMVDGNPVALTKTNASGIPTQGAASSQPLEPGSGIAAVSGGALAQGTQFMVNLDIQPSMPRDAMRVRGETQWEGMGQLELISQ